jgi:hypothetical protein
MTDPQASAAPAQTIEVESLDEFVRMLVAWHTNKVAVIDQLLIVPEGATFQVGESDDAKEVVLQGDTLAGFKFGLEMAKMQLGKLPFVAEMEDDEPAAANDATTTGG